MAAIDMSGSCARIGAPLCHVQASATMIHAKWWAGGVPRLGEGVLPTLHPTCKVPPGSDALSATWWGGGGGGPPPPPPPPPPPGGRRWESFTDGLTDLHLSDQVEGYRYKGHVSSSTQSVAATPLSRHLAEELRVRPPM